MDMMDQKLMTARETPKRDRMPELNELREEINGLTKNLHGIHDRLLDRNNSLFGEDETACNKVIDELTQKIPSGPLPMLNSLTQAIREAKSVASDIAYEEDRQRRLVNVEGVSIGDYHDSTSKAATY